MSELPGTLQPAQADQIKTAILTMLGEIKKLGYGDVLTEDLHLKNPTTFRYIVGELAKVSFTDSDHDVKGTAFEYFVRATLKGKKLGQYFTPRPVVELMVDLAGRESVVDALRSGTEVRVADPACGTGGFLVYVLKAALGQLDDLLDQRKITRATRDSLVQKLRREVFHGGDANEGVASAAKMNMIIAGDGHNNIRCENSVDPKASLWPAGEELYDLILTNPPFGTTEGDSVPRDATTYPVAGGKGQHLFLQRMVQATKPGGIICTVIDEGLLNTDTTAALRAWVLQHVRLLAVVSLPDVTFKPNKITVRSSVLLMQKRDSPDIDYLDDYDVAFAALTNLGYHGDGELVRGFDFAKVRASLADGLFDRTQGTSRSGLEWAGFDVPAKQIAKDGTTRWDLQYWNPEVRERTAELVAGGGVTLGTLNTIPTRRGKSPAASHYVDEPEGYAVVIKAGSNISRYGQVLVEGADWVEKQVFDDLPDAAKLQVGDVLISSTGQGTLGKTAVWDLDLEAVADGHVTIIRTDPAVVDPYYLADYLRAGFGREQINRLYTGGTGLIELTEEHVDRVVVSLREGPDAQSALSGALRGAEQAYREQLSEADSSLVGARSDFVAASGHS